jgi:ATP-dependent protease HslVU (ClpYQ) peptidase subunit
MASDTRVTSAIKSSVRRKIRRIGDWTVGMSGPTLWDSFTPLPFATPEEFSEQWWAWATERGHSDLDEGHRYLQGAWLLARRRQFAIVSSDGGVTRQTEPYAALGSGVAVGTGALAVAHMLRMSARDAVALAVRACIAHAEGCGGRARVVECGT